MFSCRIENSKGNVLTLTQNEREYQLIKIDGLNPPTAQINTTAIAGLDGARFNSAKLETRNIVIYLRLNCDVEANRIMLYRYFPTRDWCKFYYKNAHRDVYIECYVQSVEVTPFSENEIMQVSLICPQPYFKDVEEIIDDISKSIAGFKFPFSINQNAKVPLSAYEANRVTEIVNTSESETGVTIEIKVLDDINRVYIQNTGNGESMNIYNADGFTAGDTIVINTYRGEKSIHLLRNGSRTNIFAMLQSGFAFFQLSLETNTFTYRIDNGTKDDAVKIEFKHRSMYRGV